MYKNGTVVVLAADKTHGEGEAAIELKAGVCGMVARGTKKTDGDHQYVVDFGAYGQWYCQHREITGDDTEGWEPDEKEIDAPRQQLAIDEDDEDEDPHQEDEAEEEEEAPAIDLGIDIGRILDDYTEEEKKELGLVKIDVEADIKKRMEAIEKGECY